MLAQALEERTRCLDVSRRFGVEGDHIVEVGRHMFYAVDNLVDDPDKPPGRSTSTLRLLI